MYLSAGDGLVPLLNDGEVDALAEHIGVFGGDPDVLRAGPSRPCLRPRGACEADVGPFRRDLLAPPGTRETACPSRPALRRRAGPEVHTSPDSIIRTTPDLEEQRAQSLTPQRTPYATPGRQGRLRRRRAAARAPLPADV